MSDGADGRHDVPPPPGATPGRPGWYADPFSPTRRRYWTGSAWTFSTRDDVEAGSVEPAAPRSTLPEDATPVVPAAPPAAAPPSAGSGWPARARRSLVRPRLVVAIILGLVVGLAGAAILNHSSSSPSTSSSAPPGSATARTPTTTSPQSPAPPSGATDPSASALSSLVVRQADVASPTTVTVLPGGAGLGQPTLDLCNGRFPSESRRTGRLQDATIDGQGQLTLSTEAVLYADAAAAGQAFSELKAVAAACPGTPVPSPVGEPTVATRLGAAPDSGWPQTATVNRLAFDFTTDDGKGQPPTRSIAVYLQRGRALIGVYFAQPDAAQPAVAGQTTMAGIVGVFAGRLAALPASVVGS